VILAAMHVAEGAGGWEWSSFFPGIKGCRGRGTACQEIKCYPGLPLCCYCKTAVAFHNFTSSSVRLQA